MSTQHIGAAGELLVQYQLLKHDVDSARLTTDSGIDLVAYSPARARALTIQVKTMKRPGPAGGKGKLSLGWTFRIDCGADFLALADLSTDSVWMLSLEVASELAQEKRDLVRRIYWYVDESARLRGDSPRLQADMEEYRLERQVRKVFL